MIILWWYSILWWRKDEGGRFELENGGNFFFGESTIVFLFDPTWLVLVVGTPHHASKLNFGSHDWK